jgi:hypothetical protein
LTAILASLAICSGAQARGLPTVVGAVRPASILLAPDGSVFFSGPDGVGTKLHWSRWNRSVAVARGKLYEESCVPMCPGSPWTGYRGKVRAYGVKDHRFNRLRVTYKKKGKTISRVGRYFQSPLGRGWTFSSLWV